jgi:hypothetical protein
VSNPEQNRFPANADDRRPAWMVDTMEVALVEGHEDLEVVAHRGPGWCPGLRPGACRMTGRHIAEPARLGSIATFRTRRRQITPARAAR